MLVNRLSLNRDPCSVVVYIMLTIIIMIKVFVCPKRDPIFYALGRSFYRNEELLFFGSMGRKSQCNHRQARELMFHNGKAFVILKILPTKIYLGGDDVLSSGPSDCSSAHSVIYSYIIYIYFRNCTALQHL